MQPSGDSRGGEAPTELMDSGEFVSTVDNMDPTLAELGDEFTLGDIDGESVEPLWRLVVFSARPVSVVLPLSLTATADATLTCRAEAAPDVSAGGFMSKLHKR